MLLELLIQVISEPCFNILRTKEQLGYFVLSDYRRRSGVQGLTITVQSNKHLDYVERKIDDFMQSMIVIIKIYFVSSMLVIKSKFFYQLLN